MTVQLQEVNGVGPATERQLRAHGIDTVAALADAEPASVLEAVGDRPGMSEEVATAWITAARAMRGGAAESVDPVDDDSGSPDGAAESAAPTGHRVESFVLTVVVEGERPGRTSIVHDGSGATQSWEEWPARELRTFVGRAGVRTESHDTPVEPTAPVVEDAETLQVGRAQVAVDLGPRPGGGVRSLFGQVDPAEFGLDRPAGYRAIGLVRQIGGSAEARRTAVVAGTARPGEQMQLDFGELRLPDGLHRLLAAIELLDDQPLADAATG